MINIVTPPDKYSLIGNPVWFEIESDNQELITIEIIVNGETIPLSGYPYEKGIAYRMDIDISSVLQSFFDTESSIPEDNLIISPLDGFILSYSVRIADQTIDLFAINGGISDELDELLSEVGLNIFNYRLNFFERQFLFTTRTNSPNIELRETEIFPFVFIHPGNSITFITANNSSITQPPMPKGQACLMDFNTLRKTFYELYNEIPAYISVQVEGSYTFDVTFRPNTITENRYLLRFKNSLGGFEQIEVTGQAHFVPELPEQTTYQILNKRKVFEQRRDRITLINIISVETGYKSQNELYHLLDMICSDCIYVIYPDQSIRRCHVTPDKLDIPLPIKTPTSINLKIEMVKGAPFYSPGLDLTAPGAWILETGYWNDFARWKDNKYWID